MLRSIYTLRQVERGINRLRGWHIAECFTQEKGNLYLLLTDGDDEKYLQFIGDGANDIVFIRKNFSRARKNTLDMFEDIIGESIQSADTIGGQRILKINLLHTSLYALLFGGENSNFLAVSSAGIIIESFRDNKDLSGSKFELPSNPAKPFSEFDKSERLKNAIARCDKFFGGTYAREICSRYNLDGEATLLSLIHI